MESLFLTATTYTGMNESSTIIQYLTLWGEFNCSASHVCKRTFLLSQSMCWYMRLKFCSKLLRRSLFGKFSSSYRGTSKYSKGPRESSNIHTKPSNFMRECKDDNQYIMYLVIKQLTFISIPWQPQMSKYVLEATLADILRGRNILPL